MRVEIYAEGEKHGESDLGRGSFNWLGQRKRKWGQPLSRSKYAEIMDRETYG
jgi:hypothetical protein